MDVDVKSRAIEQGVKSPEPKALFDISVNCFVELVSDFNRVSNINTVAFYDFNSAQYKSRRKGRIKGCARVGLSIEQQRD